MILVPTDIVPENWKELSFESAKSSIIRRWHVVDVELAVESNVAHAFWIGRLDSSNEDENEENYELVFSWWFAQKTRQMNYIIHFSNSASITDIVVHPSSKHGSAKQFLGKLQKRRIFSLFE